MGMFSSMINPGRPYKKAAEQMGNYYNQAQNYMQPYQQQGQSAYAPLSNAMQSLLNPQQLQSDWIQGYEASPYASHLQNMAQQQGLNAASSMGLMGSTPALQAIQAGTTQLGVQDRDNYLNNLMQKYMSGAQLAQGIYGTGAQMGAQMGQNAMQHGNNMAEMIYGQNQAPGSMFGSLAGAGIGYLAGGPIGASIGSQIGGSAMGGGR